jgi:hypothetical protein
MADKNISYVNKTFTEFKSSLINYAQTYFPNSYNDFSDASPGSMFIEMASYVGDVMSFYVDTQVQENFLLYAKEKENLYALSYALGYRPKASYASNTSLDVYQLVPSITSGSITTPDVATYGLIIPANSTVTSTSTGTKFITTTQIDFTDTGSAEITFVNSNFYLLKKTVSTISAEIKTATYTFNTPQKFTNISITDTNVIQILDVTGSDSNQWYEVPYLAQSSRFNQVTNPNYSTDQVPYLLQLQNVPRRFVSRVLSNNTLQLEFGAGVSNSADTTILPTPDNIQLGLVPGISNLSNNYNKASIFFTREYGLAPSNGTLQVRYLVGGGITSNVPSNDLTTISTTGIYFKNGAPVNTALANQVVASVVSNNPTPSSGGRGGDEIEEVRNNALYAYSSQLRAVTKNDYIVRALSLPSDYGTIAKVYLSQNFASNTLNSAPGTPTSAVNPLSLDLYVLAYDTNKKLVNANTTLKNNLATYIDQYRMVTDAINIKNAFYINIGINFDITTAVGYNNNEVLSNCIDTLKTNFNIDRWQINQPIILSDITSQLLKIRGVQSVVKLEIINKQDTAGTTYSQYGYDIAAATSNNIIYPSLDPSIFELRYPETDIQGRVIAY